MPVQCESPRATHRLPPDQETARCASFRPAGLERYAPLTSPAEPKHGRLARGEANDLGHRYSEGPVRRTTSHIAIPGSRPRCRRSWGKGVDGSWPCWPWCYGTPRPAPRTRRSTAKAGSAAAKSAQKVSYDKQIRPIFQAHCQGCHQPAKAGGGYVMTAFDRMLKGGESGEPAIVPGKPGESHLVEQITPEGGKAEMPQDKPPLSAGRDRADHALDRPGGHRRHAAERPGAL